MDKYKDFFDKIIENYDVEGNSGHSEESVRLLESHMDIELPMAYKAYLLSIGQNTVPFNYATKSTDSLPEIRREAERLLLQSAECLSLNDGDFVFLLNEGFMFLFFRIDEGDDPPVYGFAEEKRSSGFLQVSPSLTNLIESLSAGGKDVFLSLKPKDYPF